MIICLNISQGIYMHAELKVRKHACRLNIKFVCIYFAEYVEPFVVCKNICDWHLFHNFPRDMADIWCNYCNWWEQLLVMF